MAATGAVDQAAQAAAHLRAADPVLGRLLDEHGAPSPERDPARPAPGEDYAALIRAIVGQQLSVTAARAIWGRILERFGGRAPTPEELLADDPDQLRTAVGLSHAKVAFLRSLAEHVVTGDLDLARLHELDDDTVVAQLIAVKGLGAWTSHMFLLFQLERPDVLAVGDLGIRRAVQRAYGLDELPSAAALEELAEPWRPYRSFACRVLWRSLANAPV